MTLPPGERLIGRIPIRNLWLLMLYAAQIRTQGTGCSAIDPSLPVPDLIARLLIQAVTQRLRRPLTLGYQTHEGPQTRVRGRIDFLETHTRQLLSRAEVHCSYETLTLDTPRHRHVRAALERLSTLVSDPALQQQCRSLAAQLGTLGIASHRASRRALTTDSPGRNDIADRLMMALARLAFELALPTEIAGSIDLQAPDREEGWVRRLFEKAVLGFARMELAPQGCHVRGGIPLEWPVEDPSQGLPGLLPRMVTDILIDTPDGARLLIDTKLTAALGENRFGQPTLRSEHLYQLYAYLRSQESDPRWKEASGLLLYPATDSGIREHTRLQGHWLAFATVDLTASPTEIREALRGILSPAFWRGDQARKVRIGG